MSEVLGVISEVLDSCNSFIVHYCIRENFCVVSQKQPPRGVLLKKVLLEISQNLQENTCVRVSFLIKLQALAI